jgi:hypothetical protein
MIFFGEKVDYLYEIKKNPFKISGKKTGQRSILNGRILMVS